MNKSVRNIFIASLVSASIITSAVFATPAAAQSVGNLQQQIQELLAKVAALQEQLRIVMGQGANTNVQSDITVTAVPRFCKTLPPQGLALGVRSDDVRGLQEYLRTEGYLSAEATGYFGNQTHAALAQWQVAQGLPGVGIVGPMTLERLKIWCGGWNNQERFSASPTRGAAPLSVSFSTWLSGFRVPTVTYTINFGDGNSERAADCPAPADACTGPGINTHTYTQDGTYTATLNKITDPCAGNPACMAPVQTEVVAKVQVHVGNIACTKEYRPVCASKQVVCITTPCNPVQQTYSNQCMAQADGATVLYEGQCRADAVNPEANPQCRSWNDGCNTCSRSTPGGPAMCTLRACIPENTTKPYCISYFDGSSGNRPPTISSLSGPTTLSVNQTGTWTVQASDPENGQLSYKVEWGDVAYLQSAPSSSWATDAFVQSTTFTHSYSSAGTYQIWVTVRDSAGQEAKTSTTVRVGDTMSACTMEYAPVCGQPKWYCPPGMMCATVMPLPKTYGNRCVMNAEGAEFLYDGLCANEAYMSVCTADAMQCPDGTWVGRTGPNCQFVCSGS